MKTKYIQPAREFGFAGETFNLAGEVLRTPEPKPAARDDATPALFVDRLEVNKGRALIAGEMMFEA